MRDWLRQIRLAGRSLARNPVVTGAAVICLALGVGPNTAVFSIVDAVLLRPLPYQDPDEIVLVRDQFIQQGQPEVPLSMVEFRDVRDRAESFDRLAAVGVQLLNLTGDGEPQRLLVARGSEGVFDLLGVSAAAGRLFAPEDHAAGASGVAVISHDLWTRRFGGDPATVGRVVRLNDQPTQIVGVLPEGFRLGRGDYDAWLPILENPNPPPRNARFLTVVGRLRDGVSLESALSELELVAGRMQRDHPEAYPEDVGYNLTAVPARKDLVGDVETILLALGLAVGLVLLIACANVANLLLARSEARKKEVAIRVSLGATRSDLVRQFLTESVLLALAGAALGLLLALWVIRGVVGAYADAIPRADEVALDPRVLLFTLAVAIVIGLLFGLVPSLRSSRVDLGDALTEGGKTSSQGSAGGRLRNLLVVAEVALALVVLIGGSLVAQSFIRLLRTDPGYRAEGVLTLTLSLSRLAYPDDARVVGFFDTLTDRVERVPGVRAAAVASHLPAGFGIVGDVEPEGRQGGGGTPTTGWRIVGPGYFRALGIPLLEGRAIERLDDPDHPPVVVVDQGLAARLWPGEDAVGKRLRIESPRPGGTAWREVVGVVGTVRHNLIDAGSSDQLYLPYAQYPLRLMSVVAWTEGDPEALVAPVRDVIGEVDPALPVEDVQTMRHRLDDSLSQPRLASLLFGSFALIGLLLAVVGVYGVIAYGVARRAHEIGIRVALGARRSEVVGLILRHGLALAGIGLALGLLSALLVSRLLAGFLHGVSSTDPLTYAGMSVLLLALASVASLVPAWRAARNDPAGVLRAE
jgi:putative ABC transport system permease protein